MADLAVLDSDVLIDDLRGRGPGRELLCVLRTEGSYRVTSISAFELAIGESFVRDSAAVHAVLSAPLLPLDRPAALRAGRLLASLRKNGAAIEVRDAMQAGICLEAGLPLVTRNARHFNRVPGLTVAHPDEWLEGLAPAD